MRFKFLVGLFLFSLSFASSVSNANENTNDTKNSNLGFGVYSSYNDHEVWRVSNGLFVSLNKFRLIWTSGYI